MAAAITINLPRLQQLWETSEGSPELDYFDTYGRGGEALYHANRSAAHYKKGDKLAARDQLRHLIAHLRSQFGYRITWEEVRGHLQSTPQDWAPLYLAATLAWAAQLAASEIEHGPTLMDKRQTAANALHALERIDWEVSRA